MKLRHIAIAATLAAAFAGVSASPASAAVRIFHDSRRVYRDAGPQLAAQLEATTDRLEDAMDRGRGQRGRGGRELAKRVEDMETWARYYNVAVERHGFRSTMARQRFDRFLVEYSAACRLLDDVRGPYVADEVATLHRTVDRLSGAYGVEVARGDRDWRDRDWDDRSDERWDDRGDRRRH